MTTPLAVDLSTKRVQWLILSRLDDKFGSRLRFRVLTERRFDMTETSTINKVKRLDEFNRG